MSYAIGIDLGGTNVKAVAVGAGGELLEQSSREVGDERAAALAETVRRQIAQFESRRGEPASRVGVACPGQQAPDGLSMASVGGRLHDLEGVVWTKLLKAERPVPVLNDAYAALLGEVWKGAGLGCRNVVLLTLGTGVGGAMLAGGRLVKGHLGRAGHLGHICLDADGEPDIIGVPGSLEDSIGNCTLAARSGGRFTTTRQLVEAHRAGDASASDIWLRSVYKLACAMASIINILDPEVFILGGGIARAGGALFEPLGRFMDRLEWRPQGNRVRIAPAALGDIAGALGAAYHALNAGKPGLDY
ncbi:MAG TPA: ROK family protein [Pyrinomonadaceae bacterium]|jgi:glucokinase